MLELYFIVLLYLFQVKYWWMLAVCVLINRLVSQPLRILAISSPIYWFFVYQDFQLPEITFAVPFAYDGTMAVLFFGATLIASFLVYFTTVFLCKAFDPRARHPLIATVIAYAVVFTVRGILVSRNMVTLSVLWSGVAMFMSSAFVMLAYDLKDRRTTESIGLFKRFALLHSIHNAFWPARTTQLSPYGINNLIQSEQFGEGLRNLKIRAIKILALCIAIKLFAKLLAHLFFGFPNQFLSSIDIPQLNLMNLAVYKTMPMYYKYHADSSALEFWLALFFRAFQWIGMRIVFVNVAISFLMFMGFSVDLGVLNPFRSISLADFYRRTHVFMAHFYLVFIYPPVHRMLRRVQAKHTRKNLSLWITLFFGGILYQTLAHPYQLESWKLQDNMTVWIERLFYYFILATEILLSLVFESRNKPRSKLNLFVRSLIYLMIYSILMSWAGTYKMKGYSATDFLNYILFLFGLG